MYSPVLNVLNIIHGLTIGGAEIDLVTKSVALTEKYGYKITILCLMRRGELSQLAEAAGIAVIGPLMRNRYDVFAVGKIRQILEDKNWSLVHSHLFAANWVTYLALNTIRQENRPLFVTAEHAMAQRWSSLHILIYRLIQKHATSILFPSRASAESYVAFGLDPAKTNVIPNAINVDRFNHSISKLLSSQIRTELNLGPKDFLIGVVCRMEPVKGLVVLLEAIRSLQVKLIIIGEGSMRSHLESLIQEWSLGERVHLLGIRRDIPELLSNLDLFILPSFSETFGIAVAEALLAGIPVIATQVGGIPEITCGDRFAHLVEPGDAQGLRAAILDVMEQPELAKQRAEKAREYIRVNFSVENVIKKQDQVYQEILTHKK
jgi:glycosyltransferase involved in cell wall biosynthesis